MLTLEGTQAPSSYEDEGEERFRYNLDKDQKEWEQIFRAHDLEMRQLKAKHAEELAKHAEELVKQKALVEHFKGQVDHYKHGMKQVDLEKAQAMRDKDEISKEKENLSRERETLLQEKADSIESKKQSDRKDLEMLNEIESLSAVVTTANDRLLEYKRSRFN